MHRQIKDIIEHRMLFTLAGVDLDLSAAESSPLGRILYLVYYSTGICDVIDRKYRTGYPHNGAHHTFSFHGPKREAVAVLELIKEVIDETFKHILNAEESQVLNELSYISQEILKRQ